MDQPTRYYDFLFDGIDLDGKRALDVGAGNGHLAEYMASHGASDVLCLEPESSGSDAERINYSNLEKRCNRVPQLRARPITFQRFTSEEKFDLVVLHNVVNHLSEKHCLRLHIDESAREYYQRLFDKLASHTEMGGTLVIADSGRSSLWRRLGVSPISNIEWEKHHNPDVWTELIEDSSFRRTNLEWTPITRMGDFIATLTKNRLTAFVRTAHFKLVFIRKH